VCAVEESSERRSRPNRRLGIAGVSEAGWHCRGDRRATARRIPFA
jgi:hypothetical protein